MKKALTLVITCSLYLSAAAQDKVFRFGPKAGLSVSRLTNRSDINPRPGYYAGLLFNIRLNGRWRLQPEVYFSAQGGRLSTAMKEMKNFEYYNYVAFPLLGQYHFGKGFYAEAGAQPAFLVNSRVREGFEGVPYPGAGYTSHHENIFDLLVPVGAGYQLNEHFGFNVRYNQGVTGIRRSALATRQLHQVLQAGAYMFF